MMGDWGEEEGEEEVYGQGEGEGEDGSEKDD